MSKALWDIELIIMVFAWLIIIFAVIGLFYISLQAIHRAYKADLAIKEMEKV